MSENSRRRGDVTLRLLITAQGALLAKGQSGFQPDEHSARTGSIPVWVAEKSFIFLIPFIILDNGKQVEER